MKMYKACTKQEKEAYSKSLEDSSFDTGNVGWAQMRVAEGKRAEGDVDNYKSYHSMNEASLKKLIEKAPELRKRLEPIAQKYGSNLSFKVPRSLTAAKLSNDALVSHYGDPKMAPEVKAVIRDFAKENDIALGDLMKT